MWFQVASTHLGVEAQIVLLCEATAHIVILYFLDHTAHLKSFNFLKNQKYTF